MNKPRVFVTRVIPAAGLDRVREFCLADVWTEPLPPPADVVRQKLADCEGLLSLLTEKIDGALMDAAPRLRVISNYAVGFNNIDVPAATARGIAIGNTPGVLTDATADMAFALLISAGRRIVESEKYAVAEHWKTWEPLGHIGQDLVGRTVGIVGMGRSGYAMASRCRGGWLGILARLLAVVFRSRVLRQRVVFYIASVTRDDLAYLTALIEAGRLRPTIERTYPLDDAREAVRYAMSGQARGKIVITVS